MLNRVSKVDAVTQRRVNVKPAKMTTGQAIKSGRTVEDAIAKFERGSMTKKGLTDIAQEEPFKGVSVFCEFFGESWDMINRIAFDPAHEFHNLVKDLIALVTNVGSMHFKPKRLDEEKKLGRFSECKTPKDAPWIVSDRTRTILSELIDSNKLKVPSDWPKILNYFNDDYEKIKLAESMAFCGDRGRYFLGLTDIEPDIKKLFIELLDVACGFISKATNQTQLGRSV